VLVDRIGAAYRATPAVRGKGFLARRILSPLIRGRGYEVVVDLAACPGTRLICNLDDWIPWSVFLHGDYRPERRYASFMLEAARDARVVFDIGANIGYYTVQFGHVAQRVFAFEPMAYQSATLARNIALNGLGNVVATKAAVSGEEGTLRVYFAGMENTGSSSAALPTDSFEDVPAVTADVFARERGIDHVDVVKVDVEGHEMQVLRGMTGLLAAGAIGGLFMEVNREALVAAGTTPHEVVGFLGGFGYRPRSIKTGAAEPYGTDCPDESLVYFTREA
jgi:FkbM family methyltransferase